MKWLALLILLTLAALAVLAILARGGTWRLAPRSVFLSAPVYRPRRTWYVGSWAVVVCKSVPVGV
jgi:hypothetical protein